MLATALRRAPRSPRELYLEHGFYLSPEPIVRGPLLEQAVARIPALIAGEYDTGFSPWRRWNLGEPGRVQKMDQVHLCDRTFHLLATHPSIGEWVASILDANMVQVWSTQLFLKPAGGGELGAIGWHTDRQYWSWWEGEVLTIWLALQEVEDRSGPVLYVDGSHRWPDVDKRGDAYMQSLEELEERLMQTAQDRVWCKVPALLRAGGAAIHSADLLHGSGANEGNLPRIGVALNIRTERSCVRPGVEDFGFASLLEHPFICPIIYRQSS